MTQNAESVRDLIENLRRKHYECEDCWYSCPKSGECCNDDAGDDCTCGADQHNARVDSLLRALGLAARIDGSETTS